ncbi:UDP-N-acetylmuramoyl-tripeptide--D-alanyl-D-alanine ligase [Vibrio genomosp. F10]|uniref:UDP-N-acetylmuramoyl-tripeptide--D-alanyl-D- alanine ligase n=1 Tax=Vibrio genomosp. F10 TaxID=723171 RepID=UPI0002F9D2E0|nr:UDP-N-acetylmuramoyl-tripeptide--D-alanyl-D-alanine ligase [Vibrio genomosp. F10]OEE95931.1 UDP-N-acetylmuramoyl-tripeptide--D-alanyl-D-alanine ligase [Vibrio genomosp. F10 str. 9ZD137]
MISVSLSTLAAVLNAQLIGPDALIDQVSTDTRNIESGTLFIALVGERFDAHNFVGQAVEKGASALIVSRPCDVDVPQLLVEDTKKALGLVSSWVHLQCQTPTVAITGSCGKTTVKEMLAGILSNRGQVLYTEGNFNNDIGAPLTLLRSKASDDYAVIELGANHIGEIAYTTELVKPDIALVNNVAVAHLEGFGSMDGVKIAKGEIYQGLPKNGVAVINLDSNGGAYWDEVLSDKRLVTFSVIDSKADFFASEISINDMGAAQFLMQTPLGSITVQLGIIGQHNIANALAACALAIELGIDLETIQLGLLHLPNVKGRVEAIEISESIHLIDDSYNASVPAMHAAVDLLASFKSPRWLILGNMAELGSESLALHRQVGEHAARFNFEYVLTYGEDAKVISDLCNGHHFETHERMNAYIEQQLEQHNKRHHTLLVKGANSAGMSNIVAALKENHS